MFCFLLSIYSLSFVVCTALNVLFSVKYLFFVFRSVYCSQCFCFLLSIYSLYFVLCTALNVLFSVKYLFFVFRSVYCSQCLFSVKYLFFVFRCVYCSQCFCFLLSIYSLSFILCTALNVFVFC